MKNSFKLQILGTLVLLGAGWWLAGCKSAPELTQAQAQSMIQAKYDKDPGVTFNISVNDRGMQQGVHANYWIGNKRYPNGYWADFTLTPDGKKVVKLLDGGNVIQWRPDGPAALNYSIVVVPLSPSHLKSRALGDIEAIGDSKTVTYLEDVTLDALPVPLQSIAQNPGNKLSTQRMATFTLVNGAWSLQSIQ